MMFLYLILHKLILVSQNEYIAAPEDRCFLSKNTQRKVHNLTINGLFLGPFLREKKSAV